MAHEYLADLPKNIVKYRRNQALIARAEQENTMILRPFILIVNLTLKIAVWTPFLNLR